MILDLDLSNRTVLLLGGGPSLRDLVNILEKHLFERDRDDLFIIAINDAIYLELSANLLFFRYISWFYANQKIVSTWNGTIVSSTPCDKYPKNVNIVGTKHSNDFVVGVDQIRYGRTSGHLALSLAIALGAEICVLLGYDCRTVDGRTHFHDKGSNASGVLYATDFLPSWRGWGDAARRAGVEVYNATPDSAIKEFPYRPLVEFL